MDKRNVQPIASELVDLDKSDECVACESFTTVLSDRLNKSVDINLIDMIELCDEVEVKQKNQVSRTRYYCCNSITV